MDTDSQGAVLPQPLELPRPFLAAGSLGEGVAGGAAIALAVIGLAGRLPIFMAGIATIAIGVAFLFEGAAISSRIRTILAETSSRGGAILTEVGGGVSAEFLAGIAGIALGILGLARISPSILIPVAAILFGGALTVGSMINARLNHILITRQEKNEIAREVAHEAVSATAGMQALVGLGSVTLGILSLALVGVSWMPLCLIAMMALGVTDLIGGIGITSRLLTHQAHEGE